MIVAGMRVGYIKNDYAKWRLKEWRKLTFGAVCLRRFAGGAIGFSGMSAGTLFCLRVLSLSSKTPARFFWSFWRSAPRISEVCWRMSRRFERFLRWGLPDCGPAFSRVRHQDNISFTEQITNYCNIPFSTACPTLTGKLPLTTVLVGALLGPLAWLAWAKSKSLPAVAVGLPLRPVTLPTWLPALL